jgi:hypothetical protein
VDVRGSRYVREFLRGELIEQPDYALGALTGSRFHFVGEDQAKALDPSTAPITGLIRPSESFRSPWGVPAFFFSGGSQGNLAYNRFGETRLQVDALYGLRRVDIYVGAQHIAQQVRSYQRVLGYLPAGDTVPLPARSAFSPVASAAYAEAQVRIEDIAITGGLRWDQFDPGSDLPGDSRGSRSELSPRFAVSTVLRGATVVASFGRFNQAPDYQFLVDAAFDDTTRTGRFRGGIPTWASRRPLSTSSASGSGPAPASRSESARITSASMGWSPRCRSAWTPTARSSAAPTRARCRGPRCCSSGR